jgi:pyruvate,water dikinase
MEKTIDQLGRLLASSRSLDLAIPSQTEVGWMIEAFFRGDYNFLERSENPLPAFYTPIGHWNRVVENGRTICLQDGSKWGDSFSCALNIVMGKMIGGKYQQFLDSMQAHYYFPIAIARDSAVSKAVLGVKVKPEGGCIDQTGGLAVGIRNVGNYFVLAVDALGNSFALFEFVNNRRFKREVSQKKIASGKWYHVSAEISGHTLKGYLDDELAIQYTAERPLSGHVGLWTKADSTTYFEELVIQEGTGKRMIGF